MDPSKLNVPKMTVLWIRTTVMVVGILDFVGALLVSWWYRMSFAVLAET